MHVIIPARKGSKRIPNKNIIDLNGKPLIAYSIETALQLTTEVYVSTDSEKIANISRAHGAKVLIRPDALSTDYSSTNEVIEHFLQNIDNVGCFACVQPTSPLLNSDFLKKGFDKINEKCYNTIISVTKNDNFFWTPDGEAINFSKNFRERTQDMNIWYAENGAFYITSREDFMKNKSIHGEVVGFVEMPKSLSFEIDTYEDLEIIESVIKNKEAKCLEANV